MLWDRHGHAYIYTHRNFMCSQGINFFSRIHYMLLKVSNIFLALVPNWPLKSYKNGWKCFNIFWNTPQCNFIQHFILAAVKWLYQVPLLLLIRLFSRPLKHILLFLPLFSIQSVLRSYYSFSFPFLKVRHIEI